MENCLTGISMYKPGGCITMWKDNGDATNIKVYLNPSGLAECSNSSKCFCKQRHCVPCSVGQYGSGGHQMHHLPPKHAIYK